MSLKQKLDPRRYPDMSGRMAAILGYLLEEDWAKPAIQELSITSDGYIIVWTDRGDELLVHLQVRQSA